MSTYFSPKMSYTQSNKMFKKPFAECKMSSRKSSFPLNPESFMAQANKPGIPYLSASKLKTMTLSNETNKQLITSLMLGNKGISRSQYYTKLNQSHTRLEKPVEGYSKVAKRDKIELSASRKRRLRKQKRKGVPQERNTSDMVPVKLCYTDDNHYISEGPTRVTLRGASSGYKASIAKTPCNSSDDLLNKNEDCEGVKLSVATRSGNKTTLPSRMQFGQGKRASSSYKKGQSCNNRKTSRSAESSNLKRNNPVLRKIIETLTDKINDVNAEQKIYSYLDFIDQNGTSSPFFVTKSSREHSKLRKSKRQKVALDHFKSHEEALKPASRKGLIEQKMATFKKQFSSFTAAFKLQRDENAKLKVFIAQMMKDQNESITMSPHE